MTKPAAESRQASSEHPAQPFLDTVAEVELSCIRPMGGVGVAVADAWANLIAETASFVAGRLRQDARTQHAILQCRTPADLRAVQGAYVQKAVDDYHDAAGRMAALVDEAMGSVTKGRDHAA